MEIVSNLEKSCITKDSNKELSWTFYPGSPVVNVYIICFVTVLLDIAFVISLHLCLSLYFLKYLRLFISFLKYSSLPFSLLLEHKLGTCWSSYLSAWFSLSVVIPIIRLLVPHFRYFLQNNLLDLTFSLCCYCLVTQSWLTLILIPWTVAHQAPLSTGFSRFNTVVGCHFLLQEIFLTQESTHRSCTAGGFFPTEPWGKPSTFLYRSINLLFNSLVEFLKSMNVSFLEFYFFLVFPSTLYFWIFHL